MHLLEHLWRSGISFTVSGDRELGFSAQLYDETGNVLVETADTLSSWAELERWLVDQVRLHRPQSDFARASPAVGS